MAALIEKAPRDLPLYAPYVLKILKNILKSGDITMVESSIPTFEAFCENNDGASLAADQEYLHRYEDIVRVYASFASTRPLQTKIPTSAPVAIRWRGVGLQAIRSIASSEALASIAGRQLNVIVPVLLENIWTDNLDFVDVLEKRAEKEEKVDLEREKMLRRRTSAATVRTVEGSIDMSAAALSETTADADKIAEEDIGVLAIQCLKLIFEVNNRTQIHGAAVANLQFIADRVTQGETLIENTSGKQRYRGWAPRILEMTAQWTPVQDRYVILVTTMDTLVRSPVQEDTLQQQLVLATMIASLLTSDINLIGLSVMDVLLGLIHHVLRILQLGTIPPHLQQTNGIAEGKNLTGDLAPISGGGAAVGTASVPSTVRKELLARLQECIGGLATHVYYADQISDMVAAILHRLKPSTASNAVAVSEKPAGTPNPVTSVGDLTEDSTTDSFFSFSTAKINALQAIKSILKVATKRQNMTGGGSLGRNRVSVRVWEGTQWLLRDSDGRVRKAYVDALLTWLDREVTRSDLRVFEEKPKGLTKTNRDESATNLSKRAASNASQREKLPKPPRTTFLQLLHLAVYENALQYVDSEPDILLLHLLLATLVNHLGVNAVKNGLPMIFRLQEDILEAPTPIAKIRIGSLCHGYFWALSEKFGFETSPIGRVIQNEIYRRKNKAFWVDKVRYPPVQLDKIGTPGEITPQALPPLENMESEALRPFDDRFQMVKLISLAYGESLVASPPVSPPTSPGRSFSHPILGAPLPEREIEREIPEIVKDQMMAEWNRETVIAVLQEESKAASLNGSRSGSNTVGHRNFLAVNGKNPAGTNSGTQSPKGQQPPKKTNGSQRSRSNSAYGLVGGLGALQKPRKPGENANGQSPAPASESSRNSVTRVDQLKKILASQQDGGPPKTRDGAVSDGSSESMVSYDFTASEVSYNPSQQNEPAMERSASAHEHKDRTRSKSRDRHASGGRHLRPLTSNPMLMKTDHSTPGDFAGNEEDLDFVPPVPPIPSSLAGDKNGVVVQDYADPESSRKDRSTRTKSKGSPQSPNSESRGEEASPVVDLESLLNGIDASGGDLNGMVAKPPY